MVQLALADTNGLGGDLQQLVLRQKLQRFLQAEDAGRHQPQGVIAAGGAGVGQVLGLADIYGDILALGVLAHHHAGIHLGTGGNEHGAAVLHVKDAVGHGGAGLKGDQAAGMAAGDLALVGFVAVEHRGHDALALGIGQKFAAVAKQPARGDQEGQPHPLALGVHLLQLALAGTHLFHHGAHAVRGHVDGQLLDRFALFAADLLVQHAGRAHLELIALAAHRFDEDGQVHLAAAQHPEAVGGIGILHVQRNVLQQLPVQPVADLAGGDVFPLLAGKGRIVDRKGHFDGRLADLDKGDGDGGGGVAQGIADGNALDAGKGDDIADAGAFHRGLFQPVVLVQGGDLAVGPQVGVVVVADGDRHILPDGAGGDLAYADAPDKGGIIHAGDQHGQRRVLIALRRPDMLQNGIEQGLEVLPELVGAEGSRALPGRAEHHGGVQLLVGSAEIQHQLQHLVHHLVQTGVGAVHLIDDDDDGQVLRQRLFQHKAGLGHGAFRRVHQQQHAVHHLQHPLHLAAEVGVAGGIHYVDLDAVVGGGGVLCQNGDAALPFQVAGIHHAVLHHLVIAEGAALLEHFVDQGGLAVVYVGDDSDVS